MLLFTEQHDTMWQMLAWKELHSQQSFHLPSGESKNALLRSYGDWSDSLGYGEITPQTVFLIIDWIRQNPNLHLVDRGCIVDLGSGRGNVLLAAGLAHPWSKLMGLEIVPDLHDEAICKGNLWTELDPLYKGAEWALHCADFTVEKDWIEQADLVFIHATVFGSQLMETLNELCAKCRPGTIFCLVSAPLNVSRKIRMLVEFHLEMDWGLATVFIQQRTEWSN